MENIFSLDKLKERHFEDNKSYPEFYFNPFHDKGKSHFVPKFHFQPRLSKVLLWCDEICYYIVINQRLGIDKCIDVIIVSKVKFPKLKASRSMRKAPVSNFN